VNTHLRHLIQELRAEGWDYNPTQTNGAPHFVHPQFGKVAIASTPADWEDECQYTRQRIRKATRRGQGEVLVPSAPQDPLQSIFTEIDALESELALIREGAPQVLGELQILVSPLYEKMIEERRRLLDLLGKALCSPRWKKRQVQLIGELCLIIADSTKARLNVSLEEEFPYLQVLRTPVADSEEEPQVSSENEFADYDTEAWELWFENQESNTTYHPESKPRKPSPKPKPNSPHTPVDPRTLGKKLYLGLARELHPDKTTDENERIARTHLMKQINAAHAKGDLRTLLSLLHLHGSDAQKANLDADAALHLQTALKEQRKQLQAQIREELSQLPDIDGDWRSILTQTKHREAFLRKERRKAESEAQRLREIRMELSDERGISELLRTTDAYDWSEIF